MKPQSVIEAHMSICRSAGCTAVENFADECTGCPNGHFGPYKLCLGDMVASVAQPIAGMIDQVFHTNIQNCGGCHQRRETLNHVQL